jgi:hypothetical protein
MGDPVCIFTRMAPRPSGRVFGGIIAHVMPKWLKGMVAPTLALWLCAIAFGVAITVSPNGQMSIRADLVSRLALPLVIASWVTADARKRGRQLCYDYDSFVFFAYPILAPVYLFQTRGVRAFLTLVCFAAIWLFAMTPVFVRAIVREFAS